MAGKKDCNILLTAYSSIFNTLTSLNSLDHNLEDLRRPMYEDDTECSFMDKALITSESVLKYLVLPKKEGKEERPIKISKVFAFTTDDVVGLKKDPDTKKKTVINSPKEYKVEINKETKKVYQYDDGIKKTIYKSDKEFITHRLQTIYKFAWKNEPTLDVDYIQIEDEAEGIETNVKNIFRMIDGIIKYIEEKREDHNVRVFVDITGGFRTIPVYLLFVLNVLEKRGIDVDRVLYAQMNRSANTIEIDDLTPVVKTQNFINGIHEFIEFGSAQALSKYFMKILELSSTKTYKLQYEKVIQDILDSVEVFAEAITISNQKVFKNAIDNIKVQWEKLDKIDVESILKPKDAEKPEEIDMGQYIEYRNLKLLQVFSPKIKELYSQVWNAKTKLDYIRWCLEHKFIQQALTMYIEIVPDILIKSKKYRKLSPKDVIENKTIKKRIYDTLLKIKMSNKHFLHVLKQKELNKSYGESPYKFKYWLLNQYNANIHDERHKFASKKINNVRRSLKQLLQSFATVDDVEWFKKLQDTNTPNYVNDFFKDTTIKLKKNQAKGFDVSKLQFDVLTIDKEKFNSNWKWIISTLIDKEKIRTLCVQALDTLADELKKNKKSFKDKTTEAILDEVEKIVYRKYIFDTDLDEETQAKNKSILIGTLCLKEQIKKSIGQCYSNKVILYYIEKTIQGFIENPKNEEELNINTQKDLAQILEIWNNYSYFDIALAAIENVRSDINALFDKKEEYKLRKEFMNWERFPMELLLPYELQEILVDDAPKLSKALVSTDKYSKVDDLEYLIRKNKVCINSELYKSIKNGECDLKCDFETIVNLIQLIGGADIETAERKAEKYLRIIPESIGGKAPTNDIWERDTLTLLILRTILYPYNTLKMIRNDSVHARENRKLEATRKYVKELIEESISSIEKYLMYCE